LGGSVNGVPRQDGFNITAASEIMAILCLASDMNDLKNRISRIIVGYAYDDTPITCADLGITDSVAICLKDAIKPNLVQTLEGTPAIVHGGPFANIAHGCNSIIATKTALSLADYVITEAGFGADLGAEKFFDIKCRESGLKPKAVVLVATVRALKYNGGVDKANIATENVEALCKGFRNLEGHIHNLKEVFGVNVVVAINKFVTDSDAEIKTIEDACKRFGVTVALCECWAKGGEGSISLANAVLDALKKLNNFKFCYDLNCSIQQKVEDIATKVYGAKSVEFSPKAIAAIEQIKMQGLDKLPVCIAKTQYSFSDNSKLLGRPQGFVMQAEDAQIRAGAGFVVVVCGNIMLMPGLSKKPSALGMTIDGETMEIKGLF
ncbi:MAG: formate--tetrahydrofolate ligase, partial [Clostridia bacterium]